MSNQEPNDNSFEERIRELETFRGKPYGNAFEALVGQLGENGEVGTFVCVVTCKGEKPAIMTNTEDSDTVRKLVRLVARSINGFPGLNESRSTGRTGSVKAR
jgi:hypothetical protein